MASRIKEIASKPASALARKYTDEEKGKTSNHNHMKQFSFREFNPYNSNSNALSFKNALEHFQTINERMKLDQEFVTYFLKHYVDTSMLRNVTTVDNLIASPPISSSSSSPGIGINLQDLAVVSGQITTDILTLSIRTNLPMTLIKREYIRYKRRKRIQSMPKPKLHQMRMQLDLHNPPPPLNLQNKTESSYTCLTGKVNGLPNYSSTCFFNAVLQALASVTPFIRYLERIAHIEKGLQDYQSSYSYSSNKGVGTGTGSMLNSLGIYSKKEPMTSLLLDVLMYVNATEGCGDRAGIHKKIRQILDRIASKHVQFKSYKYHQSKEQQDAQEFMQALIAAVIEESRLEMTDEIDEDEVKENTREINNDETSSSICEDVSIGNGYSLFSLDELYGAVDVDERNSISTRLDIIASGQNQNTPISATPSPDLGILDVELSPSKEAEVDDDKEEKKEEDIEESLPAPTKVDKAVGTLHQKDLADANGTTHMETKKSHLPQSVQMMVNNLSSKTPSPLSGCIGSRLQCCKCKHIRPIHESSFLEIPVIPTSISQGPKMGSSGTCRLEDCLKEFTEVERVQDVNCRACTIQDELNALEEEKMMLQEAIGNISARGDESDTIALNEELRVIHNRCEFLMSIDPDEEVESIEEYSDDTDFDKSIPAPRKVEHDKRLLVTRLPPVLCLHVKRLCFNPASSRMSKSAQHIDFQEHLNLKDLYGEPNLETNQDSENDKIAPDEITMQYKLMSVIEHQGNEFSGHYVTYRRITDEEFTNILLPGKTTTRNWAFVSDERISYVSWDEVRRCNVYMLVYEAI